MKFTKIWLPFILSLLSLGLSGFLSEGFRYQDPFQSEIQFQYPQIAAEGPGGGVYLIDNSFRRIIGTQTGGGVSFLIEGGSKEEGRFFYANDLVSDPNGDLFVLNYVHDDYGMYLTREEILHYGPDGNLISIPVRRTYEELLPSRVQRGEIWGIRADGNWLHWLVITEDGIEAFRQGYERGVLERLGQVTLPMADMTIADIDWLSNDELVWVEKDGSFRAASIARPGEIRSLYQASGFPQEVPWEIAVLKEGIAYVNLPGKEIRFLDPVSGLSRSILNPRSLGAQGFPEDSYYYYRLSLGFDGVLVTANDEAIIRFTPDAKVISYETGASLGVEGIVASLFAWILLVAALIFFLLFILGFYRVALKRKLSIRLKQIMVFVPLMLVSMIIITTIITRGFLERMTQKEELTIASLAQATGRAVDGDLVEQFDELSDFLSPEYLDVRARLHESINDNADPWNRSYYFALYRVIDEVLYGFMYQNDRIGMFYPFSWFDEDQGVYRRAAGGQIATERISDVSGDWLYAVAPIFNSAGSISGLVEIGTDLFNLRQSNQALFNDTMRVLALISFVIVSIIVLMSTLVLNSIRTLSRGVSQISQGNWDHQIQVRSNDEMSDLGESFNQMSQSVGKYLAEIQKLNSSYRRFFPEQFLNYLDIPSMTDLRLGDQVLKNMTVLFSDIRSFTDISEKMTPKENFDFLNRYLNLVGPLVRKNNGFIDKYMGDAIMALFPGRPDDAITASIQILSALGEFNREQKKLALPEIKVGVGIHSGPLMLGILGESERMQGTVISDSVNLAARLETLTKQVGAHTLISEDTLAGLAYPDMISTRYLGKIKVKGKQKALRIFEVLEGLPARLKETKIQVKRQLAQILELFEAGKGEELRKALAAYPLSEDAEPILRQIHGIILSWKDGVAPRGWDGAISFESK